MHSDIIFTHATAFVNSMRSNGRASVPAMKASDFQHFMTEVYYQLNMRPLGDFQA
ncbi:succinate dehydrogenase flavoprotein subunit [Erwinia tasmaniensis]|uniref:succinate dehydrogenase flavoprotein subunit n=1 Tax=Erwinia tasmaniensis TaxID=338565 RepID=UPI0012FE943A|nr:succinate dehydrogenase flavoprotein subunit [Erwinia tasmaniensis]